jgi:hypothetical protein
MIACETSNPRLEDFQANGLLGMLREADLQRLAPQTLLVDLETDTVLQSAGQVVVDTWFPCGSAMASFSVSLGTSPAAAVEVALIGREGAIGGIVSNGHLPSFATARVRNSGRFLQIKTTA